LLSWFFLIIFQITKASEYVAVLKGEERSRKEQNKVNGFFMIGFLIAGLIGVYLCNEALVGKTLLVHESASEQGERVDSMLKNYTSHHRSCFYTYSNLFIFSSPGNIRKAINAKHTFFPHNNTMEVIWTVVPAIFSYCARSVWIKKLVLFYRRCS